MGARIVCFASNWTRAVVIFPACVLVAAGGLKVWSLVKTPAIELMIAESWALTAGVAISEVALASWLLSGLCRKWAATSAVMLFSVFAMVSLFKGIGGQSECGCFGHISVSPWISLLVSAVSIGCLFLWRSSQNSMLAGNGRNPKVAQAVILGAGLLACVSLFFIIDRFRPVVFAKSVSNGAASGRVVVVDPVSWPGKPFPMSANIVDGERLKTGTYTLVFFNSECSLCHRLLSSIELIEEKGEIILVEVPPWPKYGFGEFTGRKQLRLDNSCDWFIEIPVVVNVDEGLVETVWNREEIKARLDERRHPG
jgi:hypothetical protein